MAIEIRTVKPTRSELRKFVKFGINLYKGNQCYVPPLVLDEIETLMPGKNPAFEHCQATVLMAYRDGRPAGRIAGIINRKANERSGIAEARFGFVEFTDDPEVSAALFGAVEEWARSQGMTDLIGPLGFSDMDHEGMLVEGFDELGTMATIYNHPYYPQHLEALGYAKDQDWVEYRLTVPDQVPPKMQRVASIVEQKYGLRAVQYTDRRKLKRDYGHALFHLINRAYDKLYGYTPLTEKQIDYYIDKYLGILRLDDVVLVVDSEQRLQGVGISIPSFSKALQRAKGRLLPLGWMHMLKALKGRNDVVDLMLVAVSEEYQNKGANALLFTTLIPVYIRNGYRYAESNLELEDNAAVQSQWQYFERRLHRRRRAYRKKL